MSKYEIKWAEVSQTSTGKTKTTLTLVDEKGTETDKVTAWGDFPNFAELQPGKSVNGNISVKVNGQFTNKTLYPEATAPAWATATPVGKGGGIAKAQAVKQEGIKVAQENRAEGVKIASTARDATLIVAQLIQPRGIDTDELIKAEWIKWRKFLWNQWDSETPDLPF